MPWSRSARELGLGLDELQRTAPAAGLACEAAWLRGDLATVAAVAGPVYAEATRLGSPAWRVEAGFSLSPPPASPSTWTRTPTPGPLFADGDWRSAADTWERAGCPYEAAMALSLSGDPDTLLDALARLDALGAVPLADRVRDELRELGVSGVPRGPSRTTRDNPAGLTGRQLDVLTLLAEGLSGRRHRRAAGAVGAHRRPPRRGGPAEARGRLADRGGRGRPGARLGGTCLGPPGRSRAAHRRELGSGHGSGRPVGGPRTGGASHRHPESSRSTTTTTAIDADRALKAKHRAMWALGDYPAVATDVIADLGPILVEAAGVRPGDRVLDVAAGIGQRRHPGCAGRRRRGRQRPDAGAARDRAARRPSSAARTRVAARPTPRRCRSPTASSTW